MALARPQLLRHSGTGMTKNFSLSEAQRLLPELERLLRQAIEARRRLEEIEQEMQQTLTRIIMLGGIQLDPLRHATLRANKDAAGHKLEAVVTEIEATGAQVKDLDMGLLDFPCLLNGRSILLCWKLGEPAIEHWHGPDEGYAKRKKIDPSRFTTSRPGKPN